MYGDGKRAILELVGKTLTAVDVNSERDRITFTTDGDENMYAPLVVFQETGQRTIGLPPNREVEGREFCPLCGSDLEDEYIPGFGLAYGGYGIYWYCTSDDCPWFYKEMEQI